ncbi:MAG: hypothetical protein HYY06_28120 [Deltaproteobacteria bacterium]|nr:hypothetical protein [Deltaproteobacteria bacterium]
MGRFTGHRLMGFRARRGSRVPAPILLALATLPACSETAVVLRARFDGCSVDPEQVSKLVFYLEPREGPDLPGLDAPAAVQDGVVIGGDDIDADDRPELVLVATRARFRIRDGFAIRLVLESEVQGTILAQAIAGDDENRQIGGIAGEDAPEIEIVDGESVTVDLPIECLCNGMDGCAGTCDDREDGCRPRKDRERYCHDGLDNDADRLSDCADPECWARGPCAGCGPEDCGNGADDDCDAWVDCGDTDCTTVAVCAGVRDEDCDNGGDDDRDGRRDCLDPDCGDDPACTGSCPSPVSEVCDNQKDDDCDRLVDCADAQDCEPSDETDCDNRFDDDCDDRIDCDDPDCYPDEACSEERCAGGVLEDPESDCHDDEDDDCDGLFDCEDDDCRNSTPEDCADSFDNDCDGKNDCEDEDCQGAGGEVCDNSFDDDCDARIDCEDDECCESSDCADLRPAREISCDDDQDDDCDGDRDCDDEDCAGAPGCTGQSAADR